MVTSFRGRPGAALTVPLAAIAVAGCGYSRTPLPDTSTPVQPHGFRTVSYPCGGLSFQAPTNWNGARSITPGADSTARLPTCDIPSRGNPTLSS